jgi:hypothetical protein
VIRAAGALTLFAGLGFGIPGVLGLKHFIQTGEVWTFLGFPTYGGGPFERIGLPTSSALLAGFLTVCLAEVVVGGMLIAGTAHAVAWSCALLPFELAFWIEFALPFGPVFGMARVALLLVAALR